MPNRDFLLRAGAYVNLRCIAMSLYILYIYFYNNNNTIQHNTIQQYKKD